MRRCGRVACDCGNVCCLDLVILKQRTLNNAALPERGKLASLAIVQRTCTVTHTCCVASCDLHGDLTNNFVNTCSIYCFSQSRTSAIARGKRSTASSQAVRSPTQHKRGARRDSSEQIRASTTLHCCLQIPIPKREFQHTVNFLPGIHPTCISLGHMTKKRAEHCEVDISPKAA